MFFPPPGPLRPFLPWRGTETAVCFISCLTREVCLIVYKTYLDLELTQFHLDSKAFFALREDRDCECGEWELLKGSHRRRCRVSLLGDVLSWSMTLQEWQRDALRRLVHRPELTTQDFDDLYAMLKSAYGIPDPQNRKPMPLSGEHLPVYTGNASPVVLRTLRDLVHVNRIVAGQKLVFVPKGITVIYGDNASGKSGYSRVLKQACRARDLAETVHTDAFAADEAENIPEAIFDIEVDGKETSRTWKRGETPPDELSTISVFDSRCARAYLDDEQEVAYRPYGLDIVENLGQRVLPELTRRLDTEIENIDISTSPFADLLGSTQVGALIANLGVRTSSQEVTRLATLTDDERTRLADLDKMLAENDPKKKARDNRLAAQRLDSLIARIEKAYALVDDIAVNKLKTCYDEALSARIAEAVAAEKFRSAEELLPGTGEQVWKLLFLAAQQFSIESAYVNESFPYVKAGARCPLCQQLLDQGAVNRMVRFQNYVIDNTAKYASEKRQNLKQQVQTLEVSIVEFGLDEAISAELQQLNADIFGKVQTFENKVKSKKECILQAVKKQEWGAPPSIDGDPSADLKILSDNLKTQAETFDRASDDDQRRELESDRTALRARANLSSRYRAVLDLIQRFQSKKKLSDCKDGLKTKPISDKAKDLANKAVTSALRDALNNEFAVLGVDRVKIKLDERTRSGKTMHKLALDLPVAKKIGEILSEGEQRAIAIGSFLAELRLAGHNGGIVFDDPVSSLDHHRRKKVASRLVAEAKQRQVVIFTHDTVFLHELREEIKQHNIDESICYLEWMNDQPGYVVNGLPWEHQKYKDRMQQLENEQKKLAETWPSYPNSSNRDKMREQYNHLRATIERAVQDIVFNGVVRRYERYIKVKNITGVVGLTTEECEEIVRLNQICHDVVSAHDPVSAQQASIPDAQQLGQDIAALKKVIAEIEGRRGKKGNTKVAGVS